MKHILSIILNSIFRFFPLNDNKIIFWGARGRIDEHPREIFYFLRDKKTEYQLKWIVDKKTDVSGLKKKEYCFYRTIKGYYEIATAKYWIQSQSIGSLIKKREGQIYIQTFHGQGALKKMGIDMEDDSKKIGLDDVSKDWDWLITTDPLNEEVMKRCINYKGKCLMLGSANTDYFYKLTQTDVQKLKKDLQIEPDKKIILYAPTFRDEDLILLQQNINKEKLLELVRHRIPIFSLSELEDYVILLRLHPQMRQALTDVKLPNNFVDVCDFPDNKPLLAISDILITDYSDISIVYSILQKPMIFYAYDYEQYSRSRGFYVDYLSEVPGPIAYSEEDLLKVIKNDMYYSDEYIKKMKLFNDKFNSLNDGKVCERFYKALCEGKFI